MRAPRSIFLCGPQGSGKSTCTRGLLAELGPQRTQVISPDSLITRVADILQAAPADSVVRDYAKRVCPRHIDQLADHAITQRAHIIWEHPIPGNIEGLALVLRGLGYRTECLVLATPVEESWLGTLTRCLEALDARDRTEMRISWSSTAASALRWPAFLDRAEAKVTFDRIAILDRQGQTCFENAAGAEPRCWTGQPFAFESLMVERARPRTEADLAALLALWQGLRPRIAALEDPVWPPADLAAFDRHLRALVADPASRFDLHAPGPDAAAAQGWIDRLAADLAAVQAGPEAKGQDLTRRSTQLLHLVAQVAGQPTR